MKGMDCDFFVKLDQRNFFDTEIQLLGIVKNLSMHSCTQTKDTNRTSSYISVVPKMVPATQ